MNLEKMTTDELLELLPDNLHLSKNSNAPSHDRWRIYNSFTGKNPKPGFARPRRLLVYTLTRLERQRKEWMGISTADETKQ